MTKRRFQLVEKLIPVVEWDKNHQFIERKYDAFPSNKWADFWCPHCGEIRRMFSSGSVYVVKEEPYYPRCAMCGKEDLTEEQNLLNGCPTCQAELWNKSHRISGTEYCPNCIKEHEKHRI